MIGSFHVAQVTSAGADPEHIDPMDSRRRHTESGQQRCGNATGS